jgi:radical SAM superfamily enzyme YgiQ (UPF0313 family)
MLKIGYMNPTSSPTRTEFNYIWMVFKCFYEDHGKYPDQVEWKEPIYKWNEVSIDNIVDELQDCDIVLFTSYVWNYKINKRIVDRLDDKIVTVLGGPQQNEEIIKDYDYLADPLAPGELFIQFFIDMYIEGKVEPNGIPFYHNSNLKLPYDFGTTNVYKRCDAYFKKTHEYFNNNLDLFERILVIYETTRGCPFQCVYCEWGGGTGTKVLKKSYDVIKDELEYLGSFENVHLDLCDANTGMFKERDREIMSLMRENGLQIGDSLSILKTLKLEQKQEMLDWMIENDITRRVISVSLQSISKQARDIAKRKDLDYDDLLKLMDHITVKWNNFENKELYIDLELIMAMPGSTLEDFYEEFKLYYRLGYWSDGRYPYMVLPATEANKDEYQEQYKIKTSKILSHFDTNYSRKWDLIEINPLYDDNHYEYDTFVECFSYSFDDYVEMFIMNKITPLIGSSWIKDYITYENVPSVAKEVWNVLQEDHMFLIYKDLVKDIFTDTEARSIDMFQHGVFEERNIENVFKNIVFNNEKQIKERLDELCKNI